MEEKLTTYEGERLFKYLGNLKRAIQEATTTENTLTNNAHRQLYQILEAEEKFLRQYSPQPQLAFTLNGLPSTDTLKADLEAMCKLEDFKDLAEKYQPKPTTNQNYKTITEKDWNKQKQKHDQELTTKTQFIIQETQDRKLELTLTEESYLDAPDQNSQKEPLLTRQATTTYRTQWGDLLHETQEKHLMAKEQAISPKKQLYTPISNFLHKHKRQHNNVITLACAIGFLTFIGVGVHRKIETQTAKRQAIARCADTNSDGLLTDKEQADLLSRIAIENNATYDPLSDVFLSKDPKVDYTKGKVEWFENYKCNK